jgi:phosphoribosylformimino-5-aminoimidazole carboxamide ribotide isomerase
MIELIPAIDIIDGKCVRLSQGDYNTQKVYNENPVEVAKEFEAHGIHRLHIVDLDGAVSRHVVNYRVLDQIAYARDEFDVVVEIVRHTLFA